MIFDKIFSCVHQFNGFFLTFARRQLKEIAKEQINKCMTNFKGMFISNFNGMFISNFNFMFI